MSLLHLLRNHLLRILLVLHRLLLWNATVLSHHHSKLSLANTGLHHRLLLMADHCLTWHHLLLVLLGLRRDVVLLLRRLDWLGLSVLSSLLTA